MYSLCKPCSWVLKVFVLFTQAVLFSLLLPWWVACPRWRQVVSSQWLLTVNVLRPVSFSLVGDCVISGQQHHINTRPYFNHPRCMFLIYVEAGPNRGLEQLGAARRGTTNLSRVTPSPTNFSTSWVSRVHIVVIQSIYSNWSVSITCRAIISDYEY